MQIAYLWPGSNVVLHMSRIECNGAKTMQSCLNCSFYSVLLCGLFSTFSIVQRIVCAYALHNIRRRRILAMAAYRLFRRRQRRLNIRRRLVRQPFQRVLAAGCEMNSEHVFVPGCLIYLTAALFPSEMTRYDPPPSRTSALLMLCLSRGYVGFWGFFHCDLLRPAFFHLLLRGKFANYLWQYALEQLVRSARDLAPLAGLRCHPLAPLAGLKCHANRLQV